MPVLTVLFTELRQHLYHASYVPNIFRIIFVQIIAVMCILRLLLSF